MEYKAIKSDGENFIDLCNYCEEHIVLENLRINGETLNFRGLTYSSDYMIIAFDKDIPIGFNALVFDSEFGFYVNQIAIKKDYKKKGIGVSLISKSKEMADALSLPVYAHVAKYNIASQKMFEKCGFEKNDKYSTEDSFFYAYNQKLIGEKIPEK